MVVQASQIGGNKSVLKNTKLRPSKDAAIVVQDMSHAGSKVLERTIKDRGTTTILRGSYKNAAEAVRER